MLPGMSVLKLISKKSELDSLVDKKQKTVGEIKKLTIPQRAIAKVIKKGKVYFWVFRQKNILIMFHGFVRTQSLHTCLIFCNGIKTSIRVSA